MTFDKHGKIIRVNEKFSKISGYTPDEITQQSKTFFELSHIAAAKDAEIWDKLSKNNSFVSNGWYNSKKGEKYELHFTLVPFFDSKNEIDKVIEFGEEVLDIDVVKKQLAESEKIFEATFNQMAVGIAHVGLSGEWIRVNQRLCEILGYSKDELSKIKFQNVTHPDDLEDDLNQVQKMLEGEINTYTMQKRYINKSGEIVWCNLTVSLIKDEFINPKFFISVVEDITQQKIAEIELSNRESHFRQLAEGLPQLVWTCDAEGYCDYLSPQWVEYTGIPEDNQLGFDWLDQVHPDDKEAAVDAWKQAHETEQILDVEFRIRRYDGLYHWFKTRALPYHDEKKKVVKWFGTNTDIEATKQLEYLLRASKDHLRQIIDNLFVFVFVLESDGTVVEVNKSALVMADLNIDEVKNIRLWDCEWWNYSRDVQDYIKTACESVSKGAYLRFDISMNAKDKLVPVDFIISPMKDENDKITHIVATAVDMTVRMKVEKKLEEYAQELKHSNEELEQFANIASHDLQEPLRMVASYTEMLGKRYKGQLDERADRYIDYAVQGAWRMQELINDLLAFSRIGSSNAHFRVIDTKMVLTHVLNNLESSIEESEVEIEIGDMPKITSDEILLGQVFQNLISNAIKFRSKDKIHIKINASKTKSGWLFSVSDNGIGIEKKYLMRIFQMFRRLHERTKYQGSGIGLAIAKKIIELHGGKIWAESKVNEGSTFYFSIPQIIKKENLMNVKTDRSFTS